MTIRGMMKKEKNDSKNKEKKNYSKFRTDKDIAMDFATKVQRKFDHLIKATVLFGSTASGDIKPGSDIDIIIILDDAAINWDMELTAWYREELGKLIAEQNYSKDLHINTIRLTTWWRDLIHGDPVLLNIVRQGQVLIDIGGFFTPIKSLMIQGKIHSTPEAVYASLQRSPYHLTRSKMSMLNAVEGVYWCMVEAAQAALITLGKLPPSPEHISKMLHENFVETGVLKSDFVKWYHNVFTLHKQISHGEVRIVKASEIEAWQEKAEIFMKKMVEIIDKLIETRRYQDQSKK
ncbi:MAG: nucleotidyltransferase domain-containing protein [Nanoarchaeota archaeon]